MYFLNIFLERGDTKKYGSTMDCYLPTNSINTDITTGKYKLFIDLLITETCNIKSLT